VPRTPSALPVTLSGYALLSADEFPAKLLFLSQRSVHPSPKKWTLSANWVFLFVYEFMINVRIVLVCTSMEIDVFYVCFVYEEKSEPSGRD